MKSGAEQGSIEPPEGLFAGVSAEGVDLEGILLKYEHHIITEALRASGGVKKKAAVLLGISFRSLRYKIAKYEEEGGEEL